MAYGFRPIAGDVKLADLGQVYAQNQQQQMQMDNNQLRQQSVLADMARQQAAEQQAQQAQQELQQIVSQPNFNVNDPATGAKLATLNPDFYKSLLEGQKLQSERDFKQAQTGNIAVDNARADMVANSTVQSQAERIKIARQQLYQEQKELKSNIGKAKADAVLELSALVAAASPEQQEAVAQQGMQLLKQRFGDENFGNFNSQEDLQRMVAAGNAKNILSAPKTGATAPTKETAEQRARGTLLAKEEARQAELSNTMAPKIDLLNQMEGLLTSGKVETGPLAGRLVNVSSNAGLFSSFVKQLSLENSALLKGAVSNYEQEILKGSVPNENLQESANIERIAGWRAALKRTQERADFNAEWRAVNGTIDGANTAWNKFIENKPIIDKSGKVNEQNVSGWQEFITGGAGQSQQPATPQGGMQQAPQQTNDDDLINKYLGVQ